MALLFSGGKDSNLALWYAVHQGWSVEPLISVAPRSSDSYMFHHPNVEWARLQAEAAGCPIHTVTIHGDRREEIRRLEEMLRELVKDYEFEAIVSGVVQSEYQKTRVDRICDNIGIASITPLWRKDPLALLVEEVTMGFKIIITACAAHGFKKDWLGRELDTQAVEEVSRIHEEFGINPVFEGGEAETFVLDSPLFKYPVRIITMEKVWHGGVGYLAIREAELLKVLHGVSDQTR